MYEGITWSVLGKQNIPTKEVYSLPGGSYWEKLCPRSRARMARDRRPANSVLIFFYRIAVKGPKKTKILHRTIKLTLAMIALVIRRNPPFFTLFTTLLMKIQTCKQGTWI